MGDSVSDHDAELRALRGAAATTKRRSYLDAIDGQRRRLRLKFISDDLLRKPRTGQARRIGTLRGTLTEQARHQMRARRRRPFRGDVAVEIDLHAIGVPQPATSPPAVKAYLDLLEGIAYPDDRRLARRSPDAT